MDRPYSPYDATLEAARVMESASSAALALLGRPAPPPFRSSWQNPFPFRSVPRPHGPLPRPHDSRFDTGHLRDLASDSSGRFARDTAQEVPAARAPADSSADMLYLLQVLLEHEKRGQGPHEALRALHGKHGYSEKEWTDLYITHAPRIHSLTAHAQASAPAPARPQPQPQSQSQPRPQHQPQDVVDVDMYAEPAPALARIADDDDGPPAGDTRVAAEPPLSACFSSSVPSTRARTRAQDQDQGRGQRARDVAPPPPRTGLAGHPEAAGDTGGPDGKYRRGHHWTTARCVVWQLGLEGRPPTPPKPVRRGSSQFAFSRRDEHYFKKLMGWAVSQNAATTLRDVCKLAGDVASHHSADSWVWFARNRQMEHALEDALREYSGDSNCTEKHGGEFTVEETAYLDSDCERHSGYKKSGCFKDSDDNFSSDSDRGYRTRFPRLGNGPHPIPSVPWCDPQEFKKMGGYKDTYTDVEKRMMAKYIAFKGDEWERCQSQEEQWIEFYCVFPQRSLKSWSHFYRKPENYTVINSLARMYRRQGDGRRNTQGHAPGSTRPDTRRNASIPPSKGKWPIAVIDLTRSSPPPASADEAE